MQRNFEKEPLSHPLHIAAYKGDLAAVKKILSENPKLINVIEKNKYGNSAVGLAAMGNHTEVVDYLLSQHAELDFNHQGKHPLHLAAEKYAIQVVELLHQKYQVDLLIKTKDSLADDMLTLFIKNNPPHNMLLLPLQWGISPVRIMEAGNRVSQPWVTAFVFWAMKDNTQRLDILHRIAGREFQETAKAPHEYKYKAYDESYLPNHTVTVLKPPLFLTKDELKIISKNTSPKEFSELLYVMVLHSSMAPRAQVFQFFDALTAFFNYSQLEPFLEEIESKLLINCLNDEKGLKAALALLRLYWHFFQENYSKKLKRIFLRDAETIIWATFRFGEKEDFRDCADYFKGSWKIILDDETTHATQSAWVLDFIADNNKILQLLRDNNYEVIRNECRFGTPDALKNYLHYFDKIERHKILCMVLPYIIRNCDIAKITQDCIAEIGDRELIGLIIEEEFNKINLHKPVFNPEHLMVLLQCLSPEKRSQFALSHGTTWVVNALEKGELSNAIKLLQLWLVCADSPRKFLELLNNKIKQQIAFQDDKTRTNFRIFVDFVNTSADDLETLSRVQRQYLGQPEFFNFPLAASKLQAVALTNKSNALLNLPNDLFNHVLSFVGLDTPMPLKLVSCMRAPGDQKNKTITIDSKGTVDEATAAKLSQKLQGQLTLWQKYTAPECKKQPEQKLAENGNKRRRLG